MLVEVLGKSEAETPPRKNLKPTKSGVGRFSHAQVQILVEMFGFFKMFKIHKPTQIQELQLRDPVQSIRHGRIISFFFFAGPVDLKFTSVFAF